MSETFTLLLRRLNNLISYLRPEAMRARRACARRDRWDGQAVWYRLRYDDAGKATVMVRRLGKAAGRRVGLRLRYVERTTLQCFMGVEPKYASVAEEMAAAFSCQLVRSDPPAPLPGLFYSSSLPDDFVAADAYIVAGEMYVLPVCNMTAAFPDRKGSGQAGTFFPVSGPVPGHSHKVEPVAGSQVPAAVASAGEGGGGRESQPGTGPQQTLGPQPGMWSLPAPSLGTSTRISLSLATPAPLLRRDHQWLVGWDGHGRSVGAYQAGVVGEPAAVHEWLTGLILSAFQNNEKNVVMLDGQGTLVDELLSRPYVTRLVQAGLVHVIDVRRSLQTAFNPLALPLSPKAVRQEAGAAIRWQWWLAGMGSQVSLDLLKSAVGQGVRTIPDFYRWVLEIRKSRPEIGTSLMTAIKRLDRDEEVREWLMASERFVDPRLLARHGIVLVAARASDRVGSGWARQQALRGMLGLLVESRSSLILHGLKLDKRDRKLLKEMRFIVSHTPASTTIITRCQDQMAQRLAIRFSANGDQAITPEHLQLLPPRSALVSSRAGHTALVSWKSGL
jgi:hypothetical protein